ncbi:hypothetical protein DENSPDRAFT_934729 [Dentipellis sp. KUC8613]|nr:hypothetical protein DENSPDRAFT_934729 [Dentipellis sp. KUC8613]
MSSRTRGSSGWEPACGLRDDERNGRCGLMTAAGFGFGCGRRHGRRARMQDAHSRDDRGTGDGGNHAREKRNRTSSIRPHSSKNGQRGGRPCSARPPLALPTDSFNAANSVVPTTAAVIR